MIDNGVFEDVGEKSDIGFGVSARLGDDVVGCVGDGDDDDSGGDAITKLPSSCSVERFKLQLADVFS